MLRLVRFAGYGGYDIVITDTWYSVKNKSITKARLITLAFGSFGVLITLVFPQMLDLCVF